MMEQTVTIPVIEYEKLERRLANLERIVDAYLMKRRHVILQELGCIEDEMRIQRSVKPKESRRD